MSLAENLSLLYSNTVTSALRIYGTATSTSTTTGALIVSGGAGFGGNIYANSIYSRGWQVSTSTAVAAATPTSLGTVFGYTTGNGNIAVGCCAGNTTMTGNTNIAIGRSSLVINTTGYGNVAVGEAALTCNTIGYENVAVGKWALYTNSTGTTNVAVGNSGLYANTSGSENVSVGSYGLRNNTFGRCNVAVGSSALYGNTTGLLNIGVGTCAGCNITTGVNNTVIGSLPAAAGCVCTLLIGAGTCERIRVDNSGLYINGTVFTGGGVSVSDDTTTNATRYVLWDDVTSGSITTAGVSSTKLYFNPSSGTLNATTFNSLSDEEYKENVSSILDSLRVVSQLDGVSFNWKDTGRRSYGVIAQELEKIVPELVDGTDKKTVNYSGIIAFLINAVKELDSRIKLLEGKE